MYRNWSNLSMRSGKYSYTVTAEKSGFTNFNEENRRKVGGKEKFLHHAIMLHRDKAAPGDCRGGGKLHGLFDDKNTHSLDAGNVTRVVADGIKSSPAAFSDQGVEIHVG